MTITYFNDFYDYARSDFAYLILDAFVFFFLTAYAARKHTSLPFFGFVSVCLALKLMLFVGARPFDAGNDTSHYYETFQNLSGVESAREVGKANYGNSELLYWPFAAIFKLLISDFTFYLSFSIMLSAVFVFLGNRMAVTHFSEHDRYKQIGLAILFTYLVFSSYEIAYFGGHIRAAFGVPLAFISYMFLLKRRRLYSLFFFLLSIGFHNSAISILPLLLTEVLGIRINRSSLTTVVLLSALCLAFLVGHYAGLEKLVGLAGDYYSQRYLDYKEYTSFNLDSIFRSGYFWIISAHILVFVVCGYSRTHAYAFYYFGLVFLFAATPKISERYFAYIMVCLPFLLYSSLRNRFNERSALFITLGAGFLFSVLIITTEGATSTLGISTFLSLIIGS